MPPPAAPFHVENDRFAQLHTARPLSEVDGRHDLAEGIWIGCEPDRGASLSFRPVEEDAELVLHDAGRSPWVSLSYGLPVGALAGGRYLGVMLRATSPDFFSYRPCLRYTHGADHGGGFSDVFAEDYVISSGGTREQLSYVPLDRDLLDRASGAEMHLFFQGAQFQARLHRLETVLIL